MRAKDIAEQLRRYPPVKAEVDEGYRGLANDFPDQVSAPPRKPKNLGEGAITGRVRLAAGQASPVLPAKPLSDTQTPNCLNGALRSAGQDAASPTPRH
ncbi:hypothetical protein [Streptomyces sp. NBC_01235]|uniref:hypothetical protein n=1 Tax=Streptomyces sp. NBC_01235 TaxID=2903788 RepID=UPI002E1433D5|nr:hypothetical protein OG289_00605 [Streptomyces sp. NBC_01235]